MSLFKNIFFLIFLVNMIACDDKNRGGDNKSLPYNNDGIGGTFAVGQRENNMMKGYADTFSPEPTKFPNNPCLDAFTGSNEALEKLNSSLTNVQAKVDCQKKCPNDYSILKRKETPFNRLAFINAGCNFSHGFGGGVCTGMVKTMQSFHHLAFWDETKKTVYTNLLCGNKISGKMSRDCLNMYREKIKSLIHKKQAVDIPGFSNLFEFSSHPAIQDIIKHELVKLERDVWNAGSYSQQKITQDLNNNKKPFLYVNNNHAIWAWKTEVKNGRNVICIRDPNDAPPAKAEVAESSCDDYMYQQGSGWKRIHRGRYIKVNPVKSIRSDNLRHQAYQASVRNYCVRKCQQKLSSK